MRSPCLGSYSLVGNHIVHSAQLNSIMVECSLLGQHFHAMKQFQCAISKVSAFGWLGCFVLRLAHWSFPLNTVSEKTFPLHLSMGLGLGILNFAEFYAWVFLPKTPHLFSLYLVVFLEDLLVKSSNGLYCIDFTRPRSLCPLLQASHTTVWTWFFFWQMLSFAITGWPSILFCQSGVILLPLPVT